MQATGRCVQVPFDTGIEKMCVIEVNVENKKIHESNDHSEAFFRCKAYMHDGEIELTGREKIEEWTFDI